MTVNPMRTTGCIERRVVCVALACFVWLSGCHSLPAVETPPSVTDVNVPAVQVSPSPTGVGQVVVAVDGVIPGSEISIVLNANTLFDHLGNGNVTVLTTGSIGDAFTVQVQDPGLAMSCEPTVLTGQLSAENQALAIHCQRLLQVQLQLQNAQLAAWVIGQPDFTSYTPGHSSNTLDAPVGVSWSASTGYLYVADFDYSRVAVWAAPASQGPNDVFELSALAPLTTPYHVSTSADKTAIANYGAHQVYVYNRLLTGDASPDIVLGGSGAQCAPGAFHYPTSAFLTPGDRLIEADSGNNRVLVYNTLGNGMNSVTASFVLGQPDQNSCVANQSASAPTANTLSSPIDVFSNDTWLVVTDSLNNRVLYWETWPIANNLPATQVFGQSSFDGMAAGSGTSGLNQPRGVVCDKANIYVSDNLNHRVVAFPFPTQPLGPPGAAVTLWLGQNTVAGNLPNAGGAAPSQASLRFPSGLAILNTSLVVADAGNNRVLIYTSP